MRKSDEVTHQIIHGDAIAALSHFTDNSIDCCVTSPPYWGLRDYGVEGQIGLEKTPEEFVARLVAVFAEVRRVLKPEGTCWVNLGDSYAAHPGQRKATDKPGHKQATSAGSIGAPSRIVATLKPKDLVGIPWRVAFALQADGWYLRQDIIWHKPNPMPESVRDRCTKAHEYIFLLTKSARYFWDAAAMQEESVYAGRVNSFGNKDSAARLVAGLSGNMKPGVMYETKPTRNRRSVWTLATMPTPEAHFATFPIELPEMCIRAGCPEGGIVVDPFSGAGTTGLACLKNGRRYIGAELNPEYVEMSRNRAARLFPLFAEAAHC
jgi:DNA modification methylase